MKRHAVIERWFDHKELKEPPKRLYGEPLPTWFEPEYQVHWMIGVLEGNEIAARHQERDRGAHKPAVL